MSHRTFPYVIQILGSSSSPAIARRAQDKSRIAQIFAAGSFLLSNTDGSDWTNLFLLEQQCGVDKMHVDHFLFILLQKATEITEEFQKLLGCDLLFHYNNFRLFCLFRNTSVIMYQSRRKMSVKVEN